MALQVGEKVPEFRIIRGPGDAVSSSELFADGPTVLHFYVFDFTGSPEGG